MILIFFIMLIGGFFLYNIVDKVKILNNANMLKRKLKYEGKYNNIRVYYCKYCNSLTAFGFNNEIPEYICKKCYRPINVNTRKNTYIIDRMD